MQSTTKYLLGIRSSFFFQGVFFVHCYLGAWDLTKECSYGLKTKVNVAFLNDNFFPCQSLFFKLDITNTLKWAFWVPIFTPLFVNIGPLNLLEIKRGNIV